MFRMQRLTIAPSPPNEGNAITGRKAGYSLGALRPASSEKRLGKRIRAERRARRQRLGMGQTNSRAASGHGTGRDGAWRVKGEHGTPSVASAPPLHSPILRGKQTA